MYTKTRDDFANDRFRSYGSSSPVFVPRPAVVGTEAYREDPGSQINGKSRKPMDANRDVMGSFHSVRE